MTETLIEVAKVSGPVGIALVVLYLIVKEFLKAQERQEQRFITIIENHLQHTASVMNELKQSIRELCIWLKKNNK